MGDRVTLAPLAPRDALEYFRSKGYAPALQRFDYRDVWQSEHARSFVVAKAMQDDVLALIRERLDTALAEGQTLEQFRNGLAPALKSAGWWGRAIDTDPLTNETREVKRGSMHRLRVIYDTNLRTAHAAGRWTRIQRTKEFFPYLEYVQVDRPTAREAHKPFDGLILPVDHPIWQRIYPPNGWFCGCDVRQTNARKMEREGKTLTTEAELGDKVKMTDWLNKRTGETDILPEGLDPAFDSNPGIAWLDLKDRQEASLLDLPGSHRATDLALVQEVRARGLRDQIEHLAIYDLDQVPEAAIVEFRLANPETPDRVAVSDDVNLAALDATRRLVAVHNHTNGSVPSGTDILYFAERPGLAQFAVVGLDGSVFRIARQDGGTLDVVDVAAVHRAFNQAVSGMALDARTEIALRTHTVLTVLANWGKLRYEAATAGWLSDKIAAHADVINATRRAILGN